MTNLVDQEDLVAFKEISTSYSIMITKIVSEGRKETKKAGLGVYIEKETFK